jgi:hypothetical protein
LFAIGLISAPAQMGLDLEDECTFTVLGLLSGRFIFGLGLE